MSKTLDRELMPGVVCVAFRHKWDPIASTERKPQFGYYEPARCDRCQSERVFHIDSLGAVMHRRYFPSPMYKNVLRRKLSMADARTMVRRARFYHPRLRAV